MAAYSGRSSPMKGRHQFRRRFSLQPSSLKEETPSSSAATAAAADHTDVDRRNQHPRSQRSVDTEGVQLQHQHQQHVSGASGSGGNAIAHDKNDAAANARHKIVVMGPAKVGKSSIISQFLYGTFSTKYKRTVEEMHHSDFNVAGVHLMLDILDTSGSYEFPAMRALSIQSADAFILVFDMNDASTFEEVRMLRDQIHEIKGSAAVPIVVVANKADLLLSADDHQLTVESVVTVDWENGFVDASALTGANVSQVFKELLVQAKVKYNLSPALRRRRRQSLPSHGAHTLAAPSSSSKSSHVTPTHGGGATSGAHLGSSAIVPSAVQLQHLQQIRDHHAKRNSCNIS